MVGAILHINGNSTVHFSCRSNHDRSHLPSKSTVVKMTHAQTQPNWASLQAEIEAHIKHAMPMKEPLEVFEPMHHLVFAAPRTTVPALCLAACELVGGCRHQAMAAASALLLLHAFTYTHEHLPLTDRPGPKPRPTVSHVYAPNIELLTSDGIFPFGFELLSRSNDPAQGNSERVLRVMVEISRAVGSQGVIEGQYIKRMLQILDGGELCHVESIKGAVEKNEGGLHACAAACGAVLGGGSEEEIEKSRKYGFYVGMMQGMVHMGLRDDVEEVRNMALNELQFFKNRDVDVIYSFMNV